MLSIVSIVIVTLVGDSIVPGSGSEIFYALIGLMGLFALIAVVSVFRLIYRLFWVVFIA